jgi:hypothetical protein
MKLENYTTNEVINYLVLRIATDKGVSKALAKELVLNALTYNLVVAEIDAMVDYLLENVDKEEI